MLKTMWLKVKDSKIFWALVAGLVLFCGGYGAGRNHKVPVKVVEHTVEDTVSKQKLEEVLKVISSLHQQLLAAESKITELKTHVKTVVRIVKTKDGTTTIDKTTETDTDKKIDEKKNSSSTTDANSVATHDKKAESDTTTHKDTKKESTPVLQDRFFVGVSTQVGLMGVANPGLEFKVRVLTISKISGWAGTEVVLPVPNFKIENTQLRVNLGISF